jgi:ribosomal protein S18 acetylase RimI-like enzyme
MLDLIRNALKFLRHRTFGEFIKRLWRTPVKLFYENTALCVVRLDLRSAAPHDPSLNIKELTAADIDKMLEVMYVSRTGLQKRFSRGERCFAVLDNGKIISFFWAQFCIRNIRELHLQFNLRPNQAWMYNAITVKTARGRGLYPNIIRYMARVLQDSGIDEAFVDVKPNNTASVNGLKKAGYTPVVLINMRKVFSTVKYKLTVFDGSNWGKLSGAIKDFDRMHLQYVTENNLCQ